MLNHVIVRFCEQFSNKNAVPPQAKFDNYLLHPETLKYLSVQEIKR